MLRTLFKGLGKIVILVALGFIFTGCAGTQKQAKIDPQLPIIPAVKQVKDLNPDAEYPISDAYDPWERFNRGMYGFNYRFDKYIYLPIVRGYEFIMPDFLEDRVSAFFYNIGELKNLTNSLLQFKGPATGTTLGRIVINSTIGLAGFFDVAKHMGLPRQNEDLGQTLGFYGIGPGPYLVLPIFGPSTLRDTFGLLGDGVTRMMVYDWIDPLENVDNSNADLIEYGVHTLEAIDKRHLESFRYYESGSPFEYELVRFLYLNQRKLFIGRMEKTTEE